MIAMDVRIEDCRKTIRSVSAESGQDSIARLPLLPRKGFRHFPQVRLAVPIGGRGRFGSQSGQKHSFAPSRRSVPGGAGRRALPRAVATQLARSAPIPSKTAPNAKSRAISVFAKSFTL